MHACPCGYSGDPVKECTCSPSAVARYQRRISGPLLDRIDLFVEVPRLEYEKLTAETQAESSTQIRARVEAARQRQRERFRSARLGANADMSPLELREYCKVEADAKALLRAAMKQFNLSARAFHRILKVARTIADLAAAPTIAAAHVAEAIQYRPRSLLN